MNWPIGQETMFVCGDEFAAHHSVLTQRVTDTNKQMNFKFQKLYIIIKCSTIEFLLWQVSYHFEFYTGFFWFEKAVNPKVCQNPPIWALMSIGEGEREREREESTQ